MQSIALILGRLNSLCEANPARDAMFRFAAETLAEIAIKKMSRPRMAAQMLDGRPLRLIAGKILGPDRIVMLRLTKTIDPAGTHAFTRGDSLVSFISLRIPESIEDADTLIQWLSRPQARSTLMHEFTHMIDTERSPGLMYTRRVEDEMRKLTSPREFNAYFQQGMSRLEHVLATDPLESLHGYIQLSPESAIRQQPIRRFWNEKFLKYAEIRKSVWKKFMKRFSTNLLHMREKYGATWIPPVNKPLP